VLLIFEALAIKLTTFSFVVPLEVSLKSDSYAMIIPIVAAIFAFLAIFFGYNFRQEELKARNDFLVENAAFVSSI
jgi:hypothetical protein